MTGGQVERRLAAILAADVAGYSRLIGLDEEGTLAALKALRRELIDPVVAEHRGRIVKTTGDGMLVEFVSILDALRVAATVQQEMARHNADIAPERRIEFRIGIHQGDIVVEDGDIFGDGVNVAARLEGIADPGGICVSARVQEDALGRLDLDFEDLGEPALKNIARPVRVYRVTFGPTASARHAGERPAVLSVPLTLPDKPSIAVLPFQNMSGDPEQEYFADGMVEEIITALSRIRWLFVIARNSSFTYKGQAVDVKRVGRELGVRYVLEGSVRKGGNQVRITAQLIEAETGAHLWADRFDGALEDVFDLQDQVASSVAGIIEPALQAAEIVRSARRPMNDSTAYDLYLRAHDLSFSSATRVPEALSLMERAVERDPNYGPALAFNAFCHFRMCLEFRSKNPEENRRKAISLATRALQAGGDDPGTLTYVAVTLAYFGEEIGAMIGLAQRALSINPNFARGWHVSALLKLRAGELEAAIQDGRTALRLSPRARMGNTLGVIGAALFLSRRFEEAIPNLLLAIQEDPDFPQPYRSLAACYAHMGRLREANEIVDRLKKSHRLSCPPLITGVPSTANLSFRACASRLEKRNEPDGPARFDARPHAGEPASRRRRGMIYRYRIALRPLAAAEGSGWLAEVPELPGVMSDGDTPQQTIDNVMDAIACWIEAAQEDGRTVPAPPGADAA